MLKRTLIILSVLSLLFIFMLSAFNSKGYMLKTQLTLNGVQVGPTEIKLENGETSEFPLTLEDFNFIRYTLSENQDQVDLTAQLIFRQGDFRNTNTLPSFSLIPDGQQASMEYKAEANGPNIHWSVTVAPTE
ncbi:hypothetical protein Sps_00880 [Shewanella psychrophila]|uniref:Uncharacterized protein n=1 Tax=Shewanella psychrophila TaxID=225848 RepID=A0A1S6HKN3_9GAMM|nr:hypothetical protein [Shewanella psychrophila]AQS36072.1 hypothetical protein Sps_00880 [Shewanella psychrophila]